MVFIETKPHLLRYLYGTTSKTTGGSVYLALSVVYREQKRENWMVVKRVLGFIFVFLKVFSTLFGTK